MSIILTILGIILTAYGLILCIMSNLNLGVVLTFLLGTGILLWGIFYHRLNFDNKLLKNIRTILCILVCIEFILVSFIGIYGQRDNINYDEDAVIVLGAGIRGDKVTIPLKLRLDKAVQYHKQNPDALIVVTGGKGFQETISEAEAMEQYLIARGVNADVIIKEEKATSTSENMRFSKQITDTYFEDEYKTVVITNNFHIYRGVYIAKLEGFSNVTHMHAGLQWYNIMPCYIRESLAVLKMWVLG